MAGDHLIMVLIGLVTCTARECVYGEEGDVYYMSAPVGCGGQTRESTELCGDEDEVRGAGG